MSIFNASMGTTEYTNPTKGSSKMSNPESVYVGTVTRVVGSQVILRIPKLNAVSEFGPCDVYCQFPVVGENVLCSYIDGRYDHIVVLAKKTLPNTSVNTIVESQVFG
jgi:hypothetical protein